MPPRTGLSGSTLVSIVRGNRECIYSRGFVWDNKMQPELNQPSFRMEQFLSVALIAIVILAAGITIYIILTPGERDKFTEFYILGPEGRAADYPIEFMAGTPQTVIIGIGNREGGDSTYTVQTFAVQSMIDGATDQRAIASMTLLDRFSVTVPSDQTIEQPYTFRIMDSNTDRIEFLLFKEASIGDLRDVELIDASYRDLHLWLRVH